MPDLAVKSLESSTRAFAGSQAAQQSVKSFALTAVLVRTSPALIAVANKDRCSRFINILLGACLAASGPAQRSARCRGPGAMGTARPDTRTSRRRACQFAHVPPLSRLSALRDELRLRYCY